MNKSDFPILSKKINNKPLVYLDSAATSQKPTQVIDAITNYYQNDNANSHRGIYKLSELATDIVEQTRESIKDFIKGTSGDLIFTKNATESLNIAPMVSLKKGDEILTTIMEHHASLIPLQLLAKKTGAVLKFIDIDAEGNLLNPLDSVTNKTKYVSITGMSNVLGTIPNIKEISKSAHDNGAIVTVDGTQLASHKAVDVKKLGCDFFAMSAHKMLGPTGIGALWAANEIMDEKEPLIVGGGMIREVSKTNAVWADVPSRFEAGTLNTAGIAGFGAAINYLKKLTMEKVDSHVMNLSRYARAVLDLVDDITLHGPGNGIMSFSVKGVHPHDIASTLDTENVCVRAGHHCAMPLMKRLAVSATTRASFHIYNEKSEIDLLVEGVQKAKKVFG